MKLLANKYIKRRHTVEPGLVLWLPFDGDVRDYSGNSNHGLNYGASWATGKIGNALSFDGVDDYVDVLNSASLKNFSAMTIIIWIKPPAPTGAISYLIDAGYWTSPYGYLIHLDATFNNAYPYLKNTAGVAEKFTTITFTPNEWIQIGLVWDGAVAYSIKNGALLAGKAFSGTVDPTANIRLGRRLDNTAPYSGTIDEVRIYNRALRAAEIWDLYQRGL